MSRRRRASRGAADALCVGAAALSMSGAVSDSRGSPECWMGTFTYDLCCFPEPDGNPICWDEYYTKAMCCDNPSAAPPPEAPATAQAFPALGGAPPEGAEDPEDLYGGCDGPIFHTFKRHANSWFLDRTFDLALVQESSTIVRHFYEVFSSCPAGALAALLLKMESAYFEPEERFDGLRTIYVTAYHRAVANGSLLASHHKSWPLLQAYERLVDLRSRGTQFMLKRRAEAATTKTRPPPVVDLVVCFCAERLTWLRAMHVLPWMSNKDRSEEMRGNVALRIYHKCPPADAEGEQRERRRLVRDWGSYFHTVEVRFVFDAARADDCSAYFAYIVDRYDSLPEYTVFLHADAPEHIPSLELLTETVAAASTGFLPEETGFAHLSHNHVVHGCNGARGLCKTTHKHDFEKMWKDVFGSSIAPSLETRDVQAYCCVQFLVKRDRIRLRPRSFYSRALHYFGESLESYYALFPAPRFARATDILSRAPCQHAMFIWHVMFGEPLTLPRRHLDRSLPLFMKLVNIEVEVLAESGLDTGVIDGWVAGSERREQGEDSTTARIGTLFT